MNSVWKCFKNRKEFLLSKYICSITQNSYGWHLELATKKQIICEVSASARDVNEANINLNDTPNPYREAARPEKILAS